MKHCAGIVTTALLLSQIAGASAAQLLVEPILLEMNGAAAGTLTLRNEESVESDVQTRVFRWLQADGRETLEPTTDAVASPPAIRLTPHSDYTVRIVRTATEPVAGEESYRVIVDQLPSPGRQMQRAVNILIRQSIPVFFRAGQLTRANVSWSVTSEHGQISVSAVNSGDERLRIASLQTPRRRWNGRRFRQRSRRLRLGPLVHEIHFCKAAAWFRRSRANPAGRFRQQWDHPCYGSI
jgi:fimbrial chaperone protein